MTLRLKIAPEGDRTFDAVALGEVMLRLDPGSGRIRTARTFDVWEGGGEYNVARGLARCFGRRTSVVTALCDNEVGRLLEGLVLAGGVDTSFITWASDDGIGRWARNGLNFTERGFGVRRALGVSDRAHTAVAALSPDDVDWEHLFGVLGVRWLHTGGVFAGLSSTTPNVILAAMEAARRHGTVISYDINYRPSLWASAGGSTQAQEVNRRLVPLVDVLFGNEEDFTAGLGYPVRGASPDLSDFDVEGFEEMVAAVVADHPQLDAVATTLRRVHSATINDWGAIAWSPSTGLLRSTQRDALEIFDRVGGGDSFASGLIHGLLAGADLATALEYGAAHGALAMTTPGDTSMASRDEVLALASGSSARVQR